MKKYYEPIGARTSPDEPRYPHMEQKCAGCLKWTYRIWLRNPVTLCFWCALLDMQDPHLLEAERGVNR